MDSALKNKNSQTITKSFEKVLMISKRKPNLIETGRGKEFLNKIFPDFLNIKNKIKGHSRNTSLGAVFAEKFTRTIGDLLNKPVFGGDDANWVVVLPTITKQYNKRVLSSITLPPLQASIERNKGYVYHNSLDKRKRLNLEFKIHDLVRTADLKKTFSKEIQLIGLTNYLKVKKLLMMQDQVTKSINFQKDKLKPC